MKNDKQFPWESSIIPLGNIFPDHPYSQELLVSLKTGEKLIEIDELKSLILGLTNNHFLNQNNIETFLQHQAEEIPTVFGGYTSSRAIRVKAVNIDGNYEKSENVRVIPPWGDEILEGRSRIIDFLAHTFSDMADMPSSSRESVSGSYRHRKVNTHSSQYFSYKQLLVLIMNNWTNLTLAKVCSYLQMNPVPERGYRFFDLYVNSVRSDFQENQGAMVSPDADFRLHQDRFNAYYKWFHPVDFSTDYTQFSYKTTNATFDLTKPLEGIDTDLFYKWDIFPSQRNFRQSAFDIMMNWQLKYNFLSNKSIIRITPSEVFFFTEEKAKEFLRNRDSQRDGENLLDSPETKKRKRDKQIEDIKEIWVNSDSRIFYIKTNQIKRKFLELEELSKRDEEVVMSNLEEGIEILNNMDLDSLSSTIIQEIASEVSNLEDAERIASEIESFDDQNLSIEEVYEKEDALPMSKLLYNINLKFSNFEPYNIASLNEIASLHNVIPDNLIYSKTYLSKLDKVKKISLAIDKSISNAINNTIQIMSEPLSSIQQLLINMNNLEKPEDIAAVNQTILNTISTMDDELNKLDEMNDNTNIERITQHQRLENRPTFNFIASEPQISFSNYVDQIRSWYLSKANLNSNKNLRQFNKLNSLKKGIDNIKLVFPNPSKFLEKVSSILLHAGKIALQSANNAIAIIDNIFELFRDLRLPVTSLQPNLDKKRYLYYYDTNDFQIKREDYGRTFILPLYQDKLIGDRYIKAISLINNITQNTLEKVEVIYQSPYHEGEQKGFLFKLDDDDYIFWKNRFSEIKNGFDFTGLDKYIAIITSKQLKKVDPHITDAENLIAAGAVLSQIAVASAAAFASSQGLITRFIAAATAAVTISLSNVAAAVSWKNKFSEWSDIDESLVFSLEKENNFNSDTALKVFAPLDTLTFIPWSNFKTSLRLIQFAGGIALSLAGAAATGVVTGKVAGTIRSKIRARKVYKHHAKSKTIVEKDAEGNEISRKKEPNEHRILKDADGNPILNKDGSPMLLSRSELKKKLAMRTFLSGFGQNFKRPKGNNPLGVISKAGLKVLDTSADIILGKGFNKLVKTFKKKGLSKEDKELLEDTEKQDPNLQVIKRLKRIQQTLGN